MVEMTFKFYDYFFPKEMYRKLTFYVQIKRLADGLAFWIERGTSVVTGTVSRHRLQNQSLVAEDYTSAGVVGD